MPGRLRRNALLRILGSLSALVLLAGGAAPAPGAGDPGAPGRHGPAAKAPAAPSSSLDSSSDPSPGSSPDPAPRSQLASPVERVVSMNPSLTAILLALGAGERLVGVDAYSAHAEPRVADLPRVGGLADPDLEGVVALRPDLVVLVPSFEQRAFRTRLRELEIPVRAFDPKTFEEVLGTIRALGAAVGREAAAARRVEAIRRARREVREAVSGRPRPRAVLVLQRDPLFVVGRGSFIDQMLRAAGARNLGAALEAPYPRVTLEWLVAAAPEVILDASADPGPAAKYWARLPSLPAVAEGRLVALGPGVATLPGPWLDRALWELARAVHGEAFAGGGTDTGGGTGAAAGDHAARGAAVPGGDGRPPELAAGRGPRGEPLRGGGE